jgi:nucleoside-diphosphate kinase
MQSTLSIIKPDAIKKGFTEDICSRIENSGLNIVLKKQLLLTRNQAEGFYAEHNGKPFFEALINFMTSGPVQVQVLKGDEAVSRYRKLMGNTNPKKASPGTLRHDFAESIDANAVHGSDSEESAIREVTYFFPNQET